MLVHGPHVTCTNSRRSLQFGPALDEPVDGAFERTLVSGAVHGAGTPHEMIDRGSAIRDDQRSPTRACFRSDHAERLRLTSVDERICAGEKTGKLATMGDRWDHRH